MASPAGDARHATLDQSSPFLGLAQSVLSQSELRARITAATRRPEPECLPPLLAEADLPPSVTEDASRLARKLAEALRAKGGGGAVEALMREYELSSQEGVALMCLAEALLRIPDRATRDALIRDKISGGQWAAHLGHSPSVFVNAATWGLLLTGRLTATNSAASLGAALTRLIGRGGEPLVRAGVHFIMRILGEQFVIGETIAEALASSRKRQAAGFRYSYDMLGEAAMTAADAAQYHAAYEEAIRAIGDANRGLGVAEGAGISIKLSALHPRYDRARRERVMVELLPRLKALAALARRRAVGLNIDAEEADRLEISLDLLEALCFDGDLEGWDGIGFVVQAYQKRAPFVLDYLIDLARRSGHRLMVRLVKGAYWDSEIKAAQVAGLDGFPVYTRKIHTDVSYIACARKLLAAPGEIFPQFATHNARTLATIHAMAGPDFHFGQYEFQCLHGMGEALYEEVVGSWKLNRPCRIYAPVGTHKTLLAYLVRRLLENGANTSFVHRVADPSVPIDDLIADPVARVRAMRPIGQPHPRILAPRDLFGAERPNSAGLDLADEQVLASLSGTLLAEGGTDWRAAPLLADGPGAGIARPVLNPADHRDKVGQVIEATPAQVDAALAHASEAAAGWGATSPGDRAACLRRAADRLEEGMPPLIGPIVREAGKSLPDAVAEIREAVDFLRYYATQVSRDFANETHRPIGPVACISPWNFPLAIFSGQVAAALAAGNPVLAKPAEETPLIAAQVVEILRECGVPPGVVQLLPGGGEVGGLLVADPRVCGVMFTGSTEVARLIQRQLARRLGPDGKPVPLIAETGGQNALVADSSALPEQLVRDALGSAFDSAGQRCSALRVLCLQEDVAAPVLAMLKGAMNERAVGNPARLSTDIGPVITAEARERILAHVERMRRDGKAIHSLAPPPECDHGIFVPPTLIEIDAVAELEGEVFGPVLHVLRYKRERLDALIDTINATGYALTFGVHSRIDETVAHVTGRVEAGNIYVNRNIIGAVVGVQPFGGHGLSGTGPKAGGPLYARRLVSTKIRPSGLLGGQAPAEAGLWLDWLRAQGHAAETERCARYLTSTSLGATLKMPGPVGERNMYRLEPRGTVLCRADTECELLAQIGAALATGNRAAIGPSRRFPALPAGLGRWIDSTEAGVSAALYEGDRAGLVALGQEMAERPGPVVPIHAIDRSRGEDYPLEWLLREISVSTNTAAAGGDPGLMSLG